MEKCNSNALGLQVWQTPSLAKSMSPMQLHRTYGTCHDDITCLDWSSDSLWIAVGAKDLTHRHAHACGPARGRAGGGGGGEGGGERPTAEWFMVVWQADLRLVLLNVCCRQH